MTKLIIKFHLLYVQTMSNRFLSPLYTRIKRSCGLHIPTRISFILLYVSYTIRMRSSLLPVRVCCWQVGPTVRNVLFFFSFCYDQRMKANGKEKEHFKHTLYQLSTAQLVWTLSFLVDGYGFDTPSSTLCIMYQFQTIFRFYFLRS